MYARDFPQNLDDLFYPNMRQSHQQTKRSRRVSPVEVVSQEPQNLAQVNHMSRLPQETSLRNLYTPHIHPPLLSDDSLIEHRFDQVVPTAPATSSILDSESVQQCERLKLPVEPINEVNRSYTAAHLQSSPSMTRMTLHQELQSHLQYQSIMTATGSAPFIAQPSEENQVISNLDYPHSLGEGTRQYGLSEMNISDSLQASTMPYTQPNPGSYGMSYVQDYGVWNDLFNQSH